MHQRGQLLLLLHLFALHLTDRCWAQESTPTTTTTDSISTTIPSLNTDDSNTQQANTTTSTMSANPDSPTPFQLSVPPTVRQCEDTVLSWSGGNTTPLFEVYYAEGPGETGDESTLGQEKLLGSSGGNNFTWTIDPSWNTKIGDVVRFRVADNNGQGQNATSWAKIAAGNVGCNTNEAPLLDSEDSFISSISQTSETTTSSSLVAQSIPSGTSVSSSQSAANPPQDTSSSSSSSAAPVPVPTQTSSPVNDPPTFIEEPSTDGSTDPVDESSQNSDDQGSNNSAAPSLETVVQDGTTLVFGGADPVTTQTARGSTPSISPEVTAAQDSKDGTAKGKLPASAVGAIVGSLICAIILSALFIIWLRKRRKARAFHPMHEEEEPSHRSSHPSTSSSYSSTGMRGAVKTLLTVPTSLVSSPSHNPFKSNKPSPLPLIIEPAGRRSLSPSPMADRDSGSYSQFLATPDAYTAMGDTFSALNSPDPFRRSFGARPVATAL